jgi:hypothetical protein
VPFHVELKDHRDVVRAFNLTEEQVTARFITPLRTSTRFSIEDKEFESRKARLIIVEGPRLATGELTLGQGWTTARKRGEDVTQRFLTASSVSMPLAGDAGMEISSRLRERVLGRLAAGPLPLNQAIGLSADLMPGHRVSERLAAIETVIWEMLHTDQGRGLTRAGEPVARGRWEATVLDESTWLAGGDPIAMH